MFRLIIIIATIFSLSYADNYALYFKHSNVGLMLNNTPYYPGARGNITLPVPYFDIQKGNFYARSDYGLMYRIFNSERVASFVGLSYYVPRTKNMDKSGVLDGIHYVKLDLPIVWHNQVWIYGGLQALLRAEFSYITAGSQRYFLALDYMGKISNTIYYELSGGLQYASANYINNWFGITAKELENNNYFKSTYQAKIGTQPLASFVQGYVYYNFSYNWSALAGYTWSRYVGDVKKSPITQSDIQQSYMIALTYKFY